MPESPVFSPRPDDEPVDPGNENLGAAIAAVIKALSPTPDELTRFGAKLAANFGHER
jgi:hypothetical protein